MTIRSPFRGLVVGASVVVIACLAFIGFQVHLYADRSQAVRAGRAWVAHTIEVMDTAQALGRAIDDAERGQRGYLITADETYLEPYRSGVRDAPILLKKLKELTADNPEQQRRLPLLEHQVQLRLGELQQTMQARQQQGFNASQQIVRTNLGLEAMAAIRGLLDATEANERELLKQRQAHLAMLEQDAERRALEGAGLAFAAILLGILMAGLAYRQALLSDKAHRASEQRVALLVEAVPDHALFIVDDRGYVTDWNAGAQRLMGYTADDMIGKHIARFYTEEDQTAGVPALLLESAARQGKVQMESWHVRKDGSRFNASVTLNALRDASGRFLGFAKSTRDISDQVQQQLALEQTRAALAQSQKMEALGQLSGGIAHDFNNLLHVIANAIEILHRRLPGADSDLRRYLDMAKRNTERAASVVQRLLAFSRQQPLDPKPVEVNKLVSGMADLLRQTLGEQVALETVLGSGLWPIAADVNQLETAIVNLAVNARDAISGYGKLTIETANSFLDESYAAAHTEVAAGQYVMIAVSDNGTGMSKEIAAKAFEPFFTTKEPGRGTGLGLSQVFGFAKQSGGHAKIYSEPGEGTTVKLYLPRLKQGFVELVKEAPVPSTAMTAATIVLVEDDEDVRAFTEETLKGLGYRVLPAADGSSALAALESHSGAELLFTDLGLPNGMNGRELADRARRRWPYIKVLYMTGYTRNAIVHHGRLDPGVNLLVKPFTQSSLAAKVKAVLQAGASTELSEVRN